MNYKDAREYLNDIAVKGSIYGLETMRILLEEIGNPQDNLKCIHVAGTNGKGSVIAFLERVLRAAGYKVGKYISPSVLDYREKIQVNGEYITEEAVAELVAEIRTVTESVREATAFEIETIMAFLYFARQQCDYVILETGLGGAEDATNIIKTPLVSVIASISMDHKNILGNTLEEIASCKAGIIKNDCPAVVMMQQESVLQVFKEKCQKMNSNIIVADYNRAVVTEADWKYQKFDYKGFKGIVIGLTGKYQIHNATVALEVLEELRRQGIVIEDRAIYEGMAKAEWPARFSCIDDKEVLFFADGAHNEDAAKSLRETMLGYFPDKKFVFIMGVLADKEYEKIVGLTTGLAEFIITITPDSPRALKAEALKTAILEVNESVVTASSVKVAVADAYEYVKSSEKADDYVIVAFGSLSYMGELYRVMADRKAEIS